MITFCKCKSYSHFFSKNISVYAIVNDQSFNNTLTNEIVSFDQLGPGLHNTVKESGHICRCGFCMPYQMDMLNQVVQK